ncbi:tetratricopeptide repeat protein [Alsobacter sp. KACC 23698]|uniref:Tetratricopeptide repeat protein n=1 Tax=Alsobacter sp. KACC 23698 TaxID=3149229 RepID=A0AAU7JHK6_9HYPH
MTPATPRLVLTRVRPLVAALALLAGCAAAQARNGQSYSDAIDAGNTLAGNYLSAVVAGASRDTSAAAFFYREALRDDPRSADLTERAFVSLLAEGSYPEALKLAERLGGAREARNGLAQLVLGIRDYKAKQYGKARSRFSTGGRNRTTDLTATLLTAWSWLGSSNVKKAIETVDTIKGEDSIAVFRNYHAGLIADLGGDKAEAERRLKAAYDAENRTLRMVDVYGRFLSRVGKQKEALEVYRTFDKLLPRHPLVTAAIASLEAGKTLDAAVPSVASGAAEVLYGLGAAGNRTGDELAAMIYLRLSLWLDQDNGLAVITLADIYDRMKQSERANDTYDMVSQSSPLRRSADIQISLNLEQLERKDEAVRQLQAVVAKNPADVEALTALGNVYRSRKEFAQAAETYSKAIDAVGTPDQGHWTLFYFRGIALERTKQWPKAEADMKKALELYPEQPLVLNYLGYSWVDQNINLDEAFKMLKRAVEQRPTDGYIVDSLGWAHYRLGQYDEAVRFLEKAIDLKPSDPVINDHLGDAYWRVGRKLEASFQWNHARDLKPEPEDLPKILEKIDKGLPDAKPAAEAEQKPAADPKPEPKTNGG